jgi:hypothetical protein
LFTNFRCSEYGDPIVEPREESEYTIGDLAARFFFSFVPVLNLVIICLSVYANTKTIKRTILVKLKTMLENIDVDTEE